MNDLCVNFLTLEDDIYNGLLEVTKFREDRLTLFDMAFFEPSVMA